MRVIEVEDGGVGSGDEESMDSLIETGIESISEIPTPAVAAEVPSPRAGANDTPSVVSKPLERGPYTTGETIDLNDIAPPEGLMRFDSSPYSTTSEIRPEDRLPAPSKKEIRGDCSEGQIQCGSVCADLRIDVNNCGECGLGCRSGHSTDVRCNKGACMATCMAGWADCDNDGSICETDLAAPNNCGACGRTCPAITIDGSAQTLACVSGVCVMPPGIADCGGEYAHLKTSPRHCGACGNACAADRNCVNGTCACADVTNCAP